MAAHPRQFVIELDGNLSPDDLFKVGSCILTCIHTCRLTYVHVYIRTYLCT